MEMTAIQGDNYRYMLYKHPDAETESLPMIVFLHGAGERGNTLEDCPKVLIHGIPALIEHGYKPRCVAVCPQCPSDSFWIAETERLYAFISEVTEKYHTDPDRLSLTGLSMGGFGTWILATRYPKLFSCIAPVCGGGMPWAAGALKKLPIRAFHGELDNAVTVNYSKDMIDAVRKHGNQNAELTVYSDVGHNAWVRAYDETLVEFLITQRRR